MKWELLGKETVIIENVKLHVGAKWLPAIKEKSGFSRKLKVNNQLITSGTTTGCIIDESDSAQIVNCGQEYLNMPLLAPAFFGEKNSLYFAKVSDELYWVVSYDDDGSIDIASDSDSVKELFPLRDYIREVMDLSDASEKFRIINIGERVYLDDQHIDARVEHKPLTDAEFKKIKDTKYKVKRQAGNLKKKLYLAGSASVGTVGFLIHSLMTSIPDEIIAIQDGEHSGIFTRDYNGVKKQYNAITTLEKQSQRMSLEKVVLMGKEEFNDYILSRGLTNQEVVENTLNIRQSSPFTLKGWIRNSVEYKNDKFLITYVRKGEHPVSSTYKQLDDSLAKSLYDNDGITISPVSLSPKGDIRTYDVLVERNQQEEYAKYLEVKRDIMNRKSQSIAKLRQTQLELDSTKREIENIEDSVNFLGVFDRRDDDVINQIISRIEETQRDAKPTIQRMKSSITKYEAIEDIVPPEHSERLLNEMGIENNLFPLFQSTSTYSWSIPVASHSFPSGVSDDKFKDIKVINASTIELQFKNGVFSLLSAKNVLEMPYIFVDSVTIKETKSGEVEAKIKISINELNQDYIF